MPSSKVRVVVVCGAGALALCLVAGFRVVSAAEVTLLTREVSFGMFHPVLFPKSLTISPDSNRVAYVARRGGKPLVVVDGVEGKEYDGAASLVFSPDSGRVAYGAQRGGKWLVVVDGVEGKEYDAIRDPVFSPDSQRVACGAGRSGKWLVVVDGVEGKEYDGFLKGSRMVFDSRSQLHTLALRGGEILRVEVEIVRTFWGFRPHP